MSTLVPVAIEDAVRSALAESDADLTVCLFGSAADVLADDALERGLAAAVDAVSRHTSGAVDVTVDVGDENVSVRITGDASAAVAEAPELAYVRRLVDRYGGVVSAVEDGVVVRLQRV